MKFRTKIAVSAAVMSGAIAMTSSAAHASNAWVVFDSCASGCGAATWTDATNTLCVNLAQGYRARAYVMRGDTVVATVLDDTTSGGQVCKKVSVPEDVLIEVKLNWKLFENGGTASVSRLAYS